MAAQQGGGGQPDTSSGILWSIAALFATLAGIWYGFRKPLVTAFLKLKLIEIGFLSHFTNNLDDAGLGMLDLLSRIPTDPKAIQFMQIYKWGELVGDYLRFPCMIIIFILAALVFFSNSVRIYKHIYSMKTLLQAEQVNWPQVSPVANLNLMKEDIDKGPWAMAMTPMQFCKRYNLLEEFKRQSVEGSRKDWNKVEVTLKRGQANKVFIMQLGPLWTGPQNLPLHTKALFGIFAGRFNSDPKAFEMLKQLAASANTKLNFTGVEELFKKYLNTKDIQKIINTHAYVLTVMASMLVAAREDGVQASADFLWLKPLDRRLWYTLNTVGRQTPFSEVAGVFAHWVSEREAGKALQIPMIEEATNALEQALTEIIYKPDEPT
jgi:intracellular multiplication protein IcmP